ncbi:MAG TPA: hypothetical protein VEZ14_09070 [Dehalococcoidia bacterium]|nr:hypothetical protein [Dehalococcoidia bacterium]
MKRLLVNLDDDTYEALRQLAFQKKAPMAKLVRYALDKTFEDDLDAIIAMKGLEEYLTDPSGTMTIQEYMESRGIVSGQRPAKGAARHRRVAS